MTDTATIGEAAVETGETAPEVLMVVYTRQLRAGDVFVQVYMETRRAGQKDVECKRRLSVQDRTAGTAIRDGKPYDVWNLTCQDVVTGREVRMVALDHSRWAITRQA
jgi:hypothetical protein